MRRLVMTSPALNCETPPLRATADLACPFFLAAATLTGASAALSARTPDIELGRYLATECMTCHRSATATSTIPNIFGTAEETFTQVMNAYRAKQLPNQVMQNIAGRLKDDEIEALAAFFARTKRP